MYKYKRKRIREGRATQNINLLIPEKFTPSVGPQLIWRNIIMESFKTRCVRNILKVCDFTSLKGWFVPNYTRMFVDKFLIVWWLLQLGSLRDRQEQFRGCRQTLARLSLLAFSRCSTEFEELSYQEVNQFYYAHHGAAEAKAEDTAEGRWNDAQTASFMGPR